MGIMFLVFFALKDVLYIYIYIYMFLPYFSSKTRHEYRISARCFFSYTCCEVDTLWIYIYIHLFIHWYFCWCLNICIDLHSIYIKHGQQASPSITHDISKSEWHPVTLWTCFSLLDGHPTQKQLQHELWKTSSVDLCREVCYMVTLCQRENPVHYLSSLNDRSSFRDEFQSMRILVYVIYLLDLWIFRAKVVGDVDCLVGYLSQPPINPVKRMNHGFMFMSELTYTLENEESKPKPLHIWVHPIWEEFLHFESFQRFTHVAVPTCSDQVWDGLVPMIVLDEWS